MATFDGGEPDRVREMVAEITQRSASGGPPEGVPAVGLMILHRPEDAKVLAITLFATEADLRQGDATLNSMDAPTPGALGRRASIEFFEVATKIDV